jgi:hypothetical protein
MAEVETIVLKKPKKERTEAQKNATAKLVASNKAKRDAKKLLAEGAKAPDPVPEKTPPKKKESKPTKESKPIEAVVEKKVRKKRVPKPPVVEHYLESESEEEEADEEYEPVQEYEEPVQVRQFRIPRHLRK